MAIALQNVNYIYGVGSGQEYHALKNINLEIGDGEFVGLVGHSGSGKSTLIQLFNGLIQPTTGTITWDGQDISDRSFSKRALRGQVGLVFQYPEHQLFAESVLQDVEFGPRNLGLPNLQVELRSFEALKTVGIGEELLDVSPLALSGGQKRRVAIAGVLAMQPKFLVLDEPMAGLDPEGHEEMLRIFRKLHEEQHITIVLVSHNMDDVARYAKRLLVMNHGEIVLDGTPAQVFQYAEQLQQIGLGVPQSMALLRRIEAQTGEQIGSAITPEECADVLYRWLEQR
ncbi:MAG: energy-coupling factor transporter ATPase [Lachnospiraceae bacterium]|nr:energy-coupling factor transporter ATPase [Lachnospiraceae bacterium]